MKIVSWNNGKMSELKAVPWHLLTIEIPKQGTNSMNFYFASSSTTKNLLIEIWMLEGRNLVCSYGES